MCDKFTTYLNVINELQEASPSLDFLGKCLVMSVEYDLDMHNFTYEKKDIELFFADQVSSEERLRLGIKMAEKFGFSFSRNGCLVDFYALMYMVFGKYEWPVSNHNTQSGSDCEKDCVKELSNNDIIFLKNALIEMTKNKLNKRGFSYDTKDVELFFENEIGEFITNRHELAKERKKGRLWRIDKLANLFVEKYMVFGEYERDALTTQS